MESIFGAIGTLGAVLWGPWTFFVLMGAGILFTVWTRFTQYAAVTHGVQVVRGLYDDPDDPGAINHFQALSAALSATVGLGNIGGVALAIGLGGPGALFWMWVIGFLGMALKTVEITLAMMYRDTSDPDNPHGGAMWVVHRVVGAKGGGYRILARAIGVFFCVTLVVSTITGGNMFQAWSVADLTRIYFDVDPVITGVVLAALVGAVIIGGIKRIGRVAGKLVPFMCLLYLIAGLAVIAMHITDIPAMLALVVKGAFAGTEGTGAFVGGSMGWAFSVGLRRAMFSNEAGQGSAPIAHSAAKTDEPAREGIVGGMGPFIDTLIICSLTAMVILLTGTWNRPPMVELGPTQVASAYSMQASALTPSAEGLSAGDRVFLEMQGRADSMVGLVAAAEGALEVEWTPYAAVRPPQPAGMTAYLDAARTQVAGAVAGSFESEPAIDDGGTPDDPSDDAPMHGLVMAPIPVPADAGESQEWDNLQIVYTVVVADVDADTSSERRRVDGEAVLRDGELVVLWSPFSSRATPHIAEDAGVFRKYDGASMTAYAFDREFGGLGRYLVTLAAWLFALSTMISWSYYGEQGMVYMLGQRSVLPYKVVFLAAAVAATAFIRDTGDMEALMDLGTGLMLWSNLPIVIFLGVLAVRALEDYRRRLKAGLFVRRDRAGRERPN